MGALGSHYGTGPVRYDAVPPRVRLLLVPCALFVLSGCSDERVLRVPNTPAANACKRECMAIRTMCQTTRTGFAAIACKKDETDCLETCPGARWVRRKSQNKREQSCRYPPCFDAREK